MDANWAKKRFPHANFGSKNNLEKNNLIADIEVPRIGFGNDTDPRFFLFASQIFHLKHHIVTDKTSWLIQDLAMPQLHVASLHELGFFSDFGLIFFVNEKNRREDRKRKKQNQGNPKDFFKIHFSLPASPFGGLCKIFPTLISYA